MTRFYVAYGLGGWVHGWFASYLNRRTQCVRRGSLRSIIAIMMSRVPQGLILFILYMADLLRLIENHGLHPHLYAEDT
jgi:sugar phosphate permease